MKNARNFADFSPEVSRLRRKVKELLDAARHNEQVHNRFQTIELALLAAQDFFAIASYLQGSFRARVNIDMVSMLLLDRGDEIAGAVCTQGRDCPEGIILVKDDTARKYIESLGGKPVLQPYRPGEHAWLFEKIDADRGSLALLPFVRRGQIMGCLALFSKDLQRYQPNAATDLLQRLAAVTAICVENCLNNEQLRRLGLTDALTGLANRRELEKRIKIEVSRTLRDSQPLSCLYLDVDYFKQVNDNYGHDVGDMVLRKVAAVMVEAVRLGDVVARYGGEEFVVLLPGVAGATALETAERIRRTVENSNFEVDRERMLDITISIGLVSFAPGANSIGDCKEIAQDILLRADRALIRAKETGRNRVVVAK